MFRTSIQNDPRRFDGDEAFTHESIEHGKKRFDPVARIHYLDHDWKILRELEDFRGVHSAVRAKPHEPLPDRRARQSSLPGLADDDFVQRTVVVLVAFTDEHSEEHAIRGNLHVSS